MDHYEMWNRGIMGFVKLVYWRNNIIKLGNDFTANEKNSLTLLWSTSVARLFRPGGVLIFLSNDLNDVFRVFFIIVVVRAFFMVIDIPFV